MKICLINFIEFFFHSSAFPFHSQVYIVGHIPPGSDERQIGVIPNGHTTFTEKNNLRYLRLIRKYSSIIQGQFFGHLHSDSFRIVYNDIGKSFFFLFNLIIISCGFYLTEEFRSIQTAPFNPDALSQLRVPHLKLLQMVER